MLLAHLLAALRRAPVLGLAWCPLAIALGTAALLLALLLRPQRADAGEDALACVVLTALGLMLLASALPARGPGGTEPVGPVSAGAASASRSSSAAPPFGAGRRANAA